MQVHENLKVLRILKGWSQEELAAKISYSLSGYTKIEHGESDAGLKTWEKIAETLGVKLQNLLGLNEANVINIAENFANSNVGNHCTIVLSETQCAHELEKSQLIIKQKNFIIEQKDKEIGRLEEIISLLKEHKPTA